MRLLIASDAWYPQINGVVRTFTTLVEKLAARGHEVRLLTPDRFRTLPCPSYPEIRLALCRPRTVSAAIDAFAPDAIHIATEGPLGWATRRHCLRRKLPFSTSFHTRFPEYIQARWRVPLDWSYRFVRAFHAPAARVMVATASIERELTTRGFHNISRWTRGVDTDGKDGVNLRLVDMNEVASNNFDLNIGRYLQSAATAEVDVETALAAYQDAREARRVAERVLDAKLKAAGFDA